MTRGLNECNGVGVDWSIVRRVRIRVMSGWVDLIFEMADNKKRESVMIRIVGGGEGGGR